MPAWQPFHRDRASGGAAQAHFALGEVADGVADVDSRRLSLGARIDEKRGQGFKIRGRDDERLRHFKHAAQGNDELDLPALHAQAGQVVAQGRQFRQIQSIDRGHDDGLDAGQGALDGSHGLAPRGRSRARAQPDAVMGGLQPVERNADRRDAGVQRAGQAFFIEQSSVGDEGGAQSNPGETATQSAPNPDARAARLR